MNRIIEYSFNKESLRYIQKNDPEDISGMWYYFLGNLKVGTKEDVLFEGDLPILSFFWSLLFSLQQLFDDNRMRVEIEESDEFIIFLRKNETVEISYSESPKKVIRIHVIDFIDNCLLILEDFLNNIFAVSPELSSNPYFKRFTSELEFRKATRAELLEFTNSSKGSR